MSDPDKLDLDDADQLGDLADRAARAAKTARRIAATDTEVSGALIDFALRAEAMAFAAQATERWIRKHRP